MLSYTDGSNDCIQADSVNKGKYVILVYLIKKWSLISAGYFLGVKNFYYVLLRTNRWAKALVYVRDQAHGIELACYTSVMQTSRAIVLNTFGSL